MDKTGQRDAGGWGVSGGDWRSPGSAGGSSLQLPMAGTDTALGLLPFPAAVTTRMGAKLAFLDACPAFPSRKDLREDWKKEAAYQANVAYLGRDILQV